MWGGVVPNLVVVAPTSLSAERRLASCLGLIARGANLSPSKECDIFVGRGRRLTTKTRQIFDRATALEGVSVITAHALVNRSDAKSLIAFLAESLVQAGAVSDANAFAKAVMDREKAGGTLIAPGIACPHGITADAQSVSISFATLAEPISWGSSGNEVRFVALFSLPEGVLSGSSAALANVYANALATIAEIAENPSFFDEFMHVRSSKELREVLVARANARKGMDDDG